jgi:hypothetical protein
MLWAGNIAVGDGGNIDLGYRVADGAQACRDAEGGRGSKGFLCRALNCFQNLLHDPPRRRRVAIVHG